MINLNEIKAFYKGEIALSKPMNRFTSLRIGGPADYYFEPAGKEDAVAILGYLQLHDFPFAAIGKGSNLLISDDGYRGAIVNLEPCMTSLYLEGNRVISEAGVSLNRFVDFCIQKDFQGVEMLAGIPGTVGGAVIMNAGAYGGEISNHLMDIEVLRESTLVILKKSEIGFSYRRSSLKTDDIVLSASFVFPAGNREEMMRIRNDYILQRNKKHPVNYPNCGSVFKNPAGNPAARFIEDAGLKGTRAGNAQISEKHANFIVNLGGAAASDVMALIEMARKAVYQKFNVSLELEVRLLGFQNQIKEISQ